MSRTSVHWHVECLAPHELGEDLIARWRGFLRDVRISPFLLPEWTTRCGIDDSQIRVAVVELNGEVAAFLPLQIARRFATPVGDRFNDLQAVIENPELLQQRALEVPIENVLRRCGISAMRFRHWHAPSNKMQFHCWESHPFYYIDLSDGFEAYAESRRGKKRHKLRREIGRLWRRAESEFGDVTVQWSTDPAATEQLLQWKQRQAEAMGWPLDVAVARQLLEKVTRSPDRDRDDSRTESPEAGNRRLHGRTATLRFNGQPIAAEYYLAHGETLHAWIRAYDVEYANFGPGHLLFWESARQAAEQGVKRIDWGSGDDQFKTKFASGAFPVHSGCADTSRLRSTLRRKAVRLLEQVGIPQWAQKLRDRAAPST